MTTERELLVRRMLVALDATSHGLVALEAAARLAGADAELMGLFVEDAALIRLAMLPAVRFATRASPAPRSHDKASMERALRARSTQAEAVLRKTASRAQLRSSFRVVRGEIGVEVARAAAAADVVVLVVDDSPTSVRAARDVADRATVVLVRAGQTLRSPVLVYDGSPASKRALAAAVHVALHDGGAVTVLAMGDTPEGAKRAGDGAASRLEARGVRSMVLVGRAAAVPSIARTRGGALTILSAEAAPVGKAFEELLRRARRPIMVVR